MTLGMPITGTPYHRNPHTVGASEKQRKIWSRFRRMQAFAPYDGFVGNFEIDSDSIYQSILNLVFECAEDGSPDAALLQALDTLPEWREMRRYVYGDPINAGLSFLGIMPVVMQILMGASGEGGEDSEGGSGQGNGGQGQGDGEGGEGEGEGKGGEGKGGEGKGGGKGEGKTLADKIKEFVEENAKDLGQSINKGKDDGGGGFSLDGEGSEFEVMNQILNPHSQRYTDLRKVMRAMGAMLESANAAIREKRKNVPGEYAGVTRGRDLGRLMSDGWMQLAVPELEDFFWADWAREEVQIMQVHGRQRAERGPLVLVVDESGSMGAEFEGLTAHEWARSILLTMCHIAQREGRQVHVVKFSSSHEGKPVRATRNGMNAQDFLWLTGRPEGGGTNFYPALLEGFARAKSMSDDTRRADVVLLTDMELRISPQWQERLSQMKKDAQAQVFCVLLSEYNGNAEAVTWLVDEFHAVSTLADANMLMSAARFVVEK